MERKKSTKKITLILTLSIVSVLIIAFAVYFFVFKQIDADDSSAMVDESKKFELSSDMPCSDPYGLSNKNNILGKDIHDVLSTYNGYTTDDYTIITDGDNDIYEFNHIVQDFPECLEDVKFSMYTENNIVKAIEYKGRYEDNSRFDEVTISQYIDNCKEELIDIRDVDPLYIYTDEDGIEHETTKDEWSSALDDKGQISIYFITDDIGSIIEVTNYYEEKKETFVICHLLSE